MKQVCMPNNIPRRHSLVGSKVQILAVENLHMKLCMYKCIFVVGKAAILKNPELSRFQKLLHWRAHMPNPVPRHQNHPSSFSSFEVMSKNVYFRSKQRPFWKKLTSDRFENITIGKLISQNLVEDTKISLLAIIVVKLWTKMYIFGWKSGHFEKSGPPIYLTASLKGRS